MTLTTERLILRHWEESDAENLYNYAKNPAVGYPAGWPAHTSVENSREIIKNVLNGKECYAVCLKDNKPIGAIELMLNGSSVNEIKNSDECELGFWLAEPFWGQGIIPEAARELLRRAFADLGMNKVWCGYYEGNEKSKRTQKKLGFKYNHRRENIELSHFGETRNEILNCITKDEWRKIIKVEVKYILKPDQIDNFYNAILSQGIDKAAKSEEGNLRYDFEIPKEKDILYLHELWLDEAALTAHGTMPHYKALAELKAKYVIETVIEKDKVK